MSRATTLRALPWRTFARALIAGATLALSTNAAARPYPVRAPLLGQASKMHSLTVANLVLRQPGDVFVAKESYRIELIEELRRLGYNALGAENLVFGEDKSDEADFVLGGTVTESMCRPAGWGLGCVVGVRWEVLDRTTKQVVYEAMTRHAELDVSRSAKDEETARALLFGAFHSLLSRTKFVDALASSASPAAAEATFEKRRFRACDAAPNPMPAQTEKVLAATVVVESGRSTGSGFLISKDGLALTAAHVVRGGDPTTVQLRDGTVRRANVLRSSEQRDVALLALDGGETPCMPLRDAAVNIGADIWAVGAPAGRKLAFSLTRGVVSGTREIEGARFLQTDASINPGNSGGPLVDADGRAAAIVSWKLVGRGLEGIAFGVPGPAAIEALALEAAQATDIALLREQPAPASVAASARQRFVDAEDQPIWIGAPTYPPGYGYAPPGYAPPGYAPPGQQARPDQAPATQRRSPGMMAGGIALTAAGAIGLITGAVLFSQSRGGACSYGYAEGAYQPSVECEEPDPVPGIATLVAGGVAVAVGVPLLVVGAKEVPVTPPKRPQSPAAWSATFRVGARPTIRVAF